jgi:hypothetical protein
MSERRRHFLLSSSLRLFLSSCALFVSLISKVVNGRRSHDLCLLSFHTCPPPPADAASDGKKHVRRVLCFFLANGVFKTKKPGASKPKHVVACDVDPSLYKECKGWMVENGISLAPSFLLPMPTHPSAFVVGCLSCLSGRRRDGM